jgi:hypothetical protein
MKTDFLCTATVYRAAAENFRRPDCDDVLDNFRMRYGRS